MSHDGTSHHARQQHRAERGLARDEEQDRAQHFEQTGDVSEPLFAAFPGVAATSSPLRMVVMIGVSSSPFAFTS